MTIKRLASGKRIVSPNEDPGTLSGDETQRSGQPIVGARNNVQNGISFVEVQDGVLETVGRIVGHVAELKGMATQDPMKSSQDVESYNNEFVDLQNNAMFRQNHIQWSQSVCRFTLVPKDKVTGTKAKFRGTPRPTTPSRYLPAVRVLWYQDKPVPLSSAISPDDRCERPDQGQCQRVIIGRQDTAGGGTVFGLFAAEDPAGLYPLGQLACRWECSNRHCPMSLTCVLRPEGHVSCLAFAADSISSMETNRRSAIGRIEDVDIAAESANLAKYSNPNSGIRSIGSPGQLDQRYRPDASPVRGTLASSTYFSGQNDRPPSRVNLQKSMLSQITTHTGPRLPQPLWAVPRGMEAAREN